MPAKAGIQFSFTWRRTSKLDTGLRRYDGSIQFVQSVYVNISFELLGVLERLAGTTSVNLEVDDGTTISDALSCLALARPELRSELDRCAVARGDALLNRRETLQADATLALLPPVAGG